MAKKRKAKQGTSQLTRLEKLRILREAEWLLTDQIIKMRNEMYGIKARIDKLLDNKYGQLDKKHPHSNHKLFFGMFEDRPVRKDDGKT